MNNPSRLKVEADVKNLAKIRNFLQQSISEMGIDSDTAYDVILAVDEAATNIIMHGYQGRPGSIELNVRRESDTLILHLRDQAPSYDPTKAPTPDLSLPLDERPLGKMGIHLMRQMVDEIIYEQPSSGGNQLTLKKEITG